MPYKHTDSNTTSDICLLVSGADLPQLLADSAAGLIAVIAEPSELTEKTSVAVDLTADTIEDLYFSWLSEIIYIKDALNLLTCRCDIEVDTSGPYRVAGKVFGDIIDKARHTLKVDVKAVTYYKLRIEKINDHWEAEAVLDL